MWTITEMIRKVIMDIDDDNLQIDVFNFVNMKNSYIINIQYGIDFRVLTIPKYIKNEDEVYMLIKNEADCLIRKRGDSNGESS